MLRVEVRVFAFLRQQVRPGLTDDPREPFNVMVPPETSLTKLTEILFTAPEGAIITLVNGLRQPLDYVIRDGDRVGLFPPIGGG